MKRRHVLAGIAGAFAAWSASARAQQGKVPVVGFLASNALADIQNLLGGLRKGLGEAGYVEGQTLNIEFLSCDGEYGRLPALAASFVSRKVDVIVAQGPPAAHAAKAATTTIPIVFATGADPVDEDLVDSLARPGANRTGVAMFMTALVARRLDLMIEMMPAARRFALLLNPNFPSLWLGSVEDVARAKGVQLLVIKVGTDADIDTAFVTMKQERIEAFLNGQDAFLGLRRKIPEMALQHKLPMMGFIRSNALQGAVATYGADLPDSFRVIGTMAGKILKGANPGELAVQRSARFELVLNLKTAKAIGLEVPPLLLARADEVIE